MEIKVFATVFLTVLLAELGDKSQLATILFASDVDVSKWAVFFGSAAALVVISAIGVLVGTTLSDFINPRILNYIAGVVFIAIGAFTIYQA